MTSPFSVSRVYRGSPHLPVGRNAITGFPAGNDLDVRLPVKIGQAGVTISRGVFTVKNSGGVIVVQKIITSTATASGQVTDTGADGLGEVLFLLVPVQTALFTTPYTFDAVVVLSNGDVQTIESGVILLTEKVTSDPANVSAIDHIDVTPTPVAITLAATQQFTATPRDNANTALTGRIVEWTTSDLSIATVDDNGLVTGLTEGTVNIGAHAEGISGYAQVTVTTDDIATLIVNTGGNASWPAFYDSREGVRAVGAAVWVHDDARCSTSTGRAHFGNVGSLSTSANETLFDGATRATWIMWGQGGARATITVGMAVGVEDVFSVVLSNTADSSVVDFTCYVGSGLGNGGLFTPSIPRNAPVKAAFVYDGTLATNADRLKLYWSWFDKGTGTWSADVQATLGFTGTIPASLPASAAALRVGQQGLTQWLSTGFVDEVRLWAGTALTSAQIAQETLSAAPATPNLRYQFNSNGTNTGSTAGHDLTVGANVVYCSDDLRFGDPRVFLGAGRPTYDAVAQTITYDGSDDRGRATGSALQLITGDCAVLWGGVLPVWGAGSEYVFDLSVDELDTSVTSLLARATAAGTLTCDAELGSPTVAVTYSTGRRILHVRRLRAGGNVTLGARVGSAAEVTQAVAVGSDPSPFRLATGARRDGTLFGDLVERFVAVHKGDWTPAEQTEANTWANVRHAVVL